MEKLKNLPENEKHLWWYQTVLGEIGIAEERGAITEVYLSRTQYEQKKQLKEKRIKGKKALEWGLVGSREPKAEETPLLKQAEIQLIEYLSGERQCFDLPLAPTGTAFQQRVWEALLEIPYGRTESYQEIARRIGCEKGCRAVGGANNKNPIPLFIPCHRVIGADGKPVGYAGGLPLKQLLLTLEAGK